MSKAASKELERYTKTRFREIGRSIYWDFYTQKYISHINTLIWMLSKFTERKK